MNDVLERIFKESFGVDAIDDSMSVDNVKGWDSMAHVGLIMALQKEFGISITPAQAIELTDIAGIKKFLQQQDAK
jgi:acyl carrier protein